MALRVAVTIDSAVTSSDSAVTSTPAPSLHAETLQELKQILSHIKSRERQALSGQMQALVDELHGHLLQDLASH
jgi:hypothetical protein